MAIEVLRPEGCWCPWTVQVSGLALGVTGLMFFMAHSNAGTATVTAKDRRNSNRIVTIWLQKPQTAAQWQQVGTQALPLAVLGAIWILILLLLVRYLDATVDRNESSDFRNITARST